MARNPASLTEREFNKHFVNSCNYGSSGGDWPHSTILFFNIRMKSRECGDGPDDDWYRVDNTTDNHVEVEMIKRLSELINPLSGSATLRIYLSYSPCSKCADKLIRYKHQAHNLDIKIRFGTFYKTDVRYYNDEARTNRQGLVELVKNNVDLHVFNCKADWLKFQEYIPCEDRTILFTKKLTYERKEREEKDQTILKEIKDQADREMSSSF